MAERASKPATSSRTGRGPAPGGLTIHPIRLTIRYWAARIFVFALTRALFRIRYEGELVEVDARPSDAIAVAVTCNPQLPIYVAEDVLNDVIGEQS